MKLTRCSNLRRLTGGCSWSTESARMLRVASTTRSTFSIGSRSLGLEDEEMDCSAFSQLSDQAIWDAKTTNWAYRKTGIIKRDLVEVKEMYQNGKRTWRICTCGSVHVRARTPCAKQFFFINPKIFKSCRCYFQSTLFTDLAQDRPYSVISHKYWTLTILCNDGSLAVEGTT